MKKHPVSFFLIASIFLFSGSPLQKTKPAWRTGGTGRWTGHITMEEKFTITTAVATAENKRNIQASFLNALPTLHRENETTDPASTDNKGPGSHTFRSEVRLFDGRTCVTDCSSSDKAELLEVVIDEEENKYRIEVISPTCIGTICDYEGGTKPWEETLTVIVTDHPLGNSKDVLSGTKTETGDLQDGLGSYTRTITWHFVRTTENDVELIVIPDQYNSWLPEPGKNELNKGTVMTINLKLQGKNGKPLQVKAESFKLRLNNTSSESGITINYPAEPDANQLPDLRFLVHPGIESIDEDQVISVSSPDGITGKTWIASYDGGAWTTLTAEAILKEDGRHIQGRLLNPGGETDIRIPKRDPNSHIAESWLKNYKNPGELDDKEISPENKHNGDGLTAYEEYRGVISESKFKRLNPTIKEVGVVARQKDFALFKTGIDWFESAGFIKVIRFDYDRDEIRWDGRLNFNGKTSHDFNQYAIFVANGSLGSTGTLGVCYGRREPLIPANITGVIIDWAYIQKAYLKRINEAKPDKPKFSLSEYLAQTVAHELGHAVNIPHHGIDDVQGPFEYDLPDDSGKVRIIDRNSKLMTNGHYTLESVGFVKGTVESGDMLCMLNYYPYYRWGYSSGLNGSQIFNEVPLLPLGRTFCKDKEGTGINSTQLYFGNAANGECLSRIQLRN